MRPCTGFTGTDRSRHLVAVALLRELRLLVVDALGEVGYTYGLPADGIAHSARLVVVGAP